MKSHIKTFFVFDELVIPVKIYKERRLNTRLSILKDKVIIRMPVFLNKALYNKNIEWAKQKIKLQLNKNERLRQNFTFKQYKTGDSFIINGKKFFLNVNDNKASKTFKARLSGDTIYIEIPADADPILVNKSIKTLLSRIMAQYFLPEISHRIHEINAKHFGFDINNIRLKYNKSNWGSRSAKNNINISTRLLFAPKDVQDYVFVHELAHFIEMNHSSRFWDIVKKVIPDYKEKEKWLKIHGHECDF